MGYLHRWRETDFDDARVHIRLRRCRSEAGRNNSRPVVAALFAILRRVQSHQVVGRQCACQMLVGPRFVRSTKSVRFSSCRLLTTAIRRSSRVIFAFKAVTTRKTQEKNDKKPSNPSKTHENPLKLGKTWNTHRRKQKTSYFEPQTFLKLEGSSCFPRLFI